MELDESEHKISIQVVEGGHLNLGFNSYTTTFQLNAIGERETSVDIMVAYESEVEKTTIASKTTATALAFIKWLLPRKLSFEWLCFLEFHYNLCENGLT